MTLKEVSEVHYIIVDDSEIKVGDIVVEKLLTGGYELFEIHTPNDIDEVRQKKVTHSTQPLGKPLFFTNAFESELSLSVNGLNDTVIENWGCKKLSLSEVEEAINGYSVEKIIRQYTGEEMDRDDKKLYAILHSVLKQYKELVKDKLFTIEDIDKAIEYGHESKMPFNENWYDEFIQSLLPKTEWEVEFVDGKLKLKQ